MTKIFGPMGHPLGCLGALSQQDTILGAGQLQILVIWGPYRPSVVMALETHAENLKTAGAWCVLNLFTESSIRPVLDRGPGNKGSSTDGFRGNLSEEIAPHSH